MPDDAPLSDADVKRGLLRFRRRSESTASEPGRLRRLADRAQTKLADQRGELQTLRSDVPVLLRLVRAYVRGGYRRVPWRSLTLITAGLLYFVAPVDLIPDFILGTGLLDDAAVVAFVIRFIRRDLDAFGEWEASLEPQALPPAQDAD